MSGARLTYCGNVHPAADLDAWLATTEAHAVPIARASEAVGRAFGLGAWWNQRIAHQLATDPAARARVAAFLAEHRLTLWTLNAFPFGGFHDARVKTAVYSPDWSEPARLDYTLDVARAAAALAPEGATVPISTLPLGYRERGATDAELAAMARALVLVARDLAALEDATGRRIVLALEPEPDCLLERVDATVGFLVERCFAAADDAERLRRHLGVCIDLCHLAVVGEPVPGAIAALDAAGVVLAKVQVSSCLELRDPARGLDRLLAFDEPRYLHQTVADDGTRALDLGGVGARRAEFARAKTVRTHFHLPVFWDEPGPLGSTRDLMEAALDALPRPLPLLEVETYTWSVLDPDWRPERDLNRGILRELDHVSGRI